MPPVTVVEGAARRRLVLVSPWAVTGCGVVACGVSVCSRLSVTYQRPFGGAQEAGGKVFRGVRSLGPYRPFVRGSVGR